jgi:hypothetical protein
MPYEELLGWLEYFERRPIEWRSDDRTYKLLQAQGVKEKPGALFSSLRTIYNQPKSADSGKINNAFKESLLYQKLLNSVSGDKIA